MARDRWHRGAAVFVLASVCGAMCSCNIVAPATYLALGQPKREARYELEDRPTAIFIDDRNKCWNDLDTLRLQ